MAAIKPAFPGASDPDGSVADGGIAQRALLAPDCVIARPLERRGGSGTIALIAGCATQANHHIKRSPSSGVQRANVPSALALRGGS
jgi:hypothetical protein